MNTALDHMEDESWRASYEDKMDHIMGEVHEEGYPSHGTQAEKDAYMEDLCQGDIQKYAEDNGISYQEAEKRF